MRRVAKQWAGAIADYNAALAIDADDYRALMGRAATHYASGDLEKAVADYAETVKQHPQEAQPFNDYAWLLATAPQDGVRNGTRAVEIADQACKLTDYKNPAYLDTLAAAFAEKGDFANALKWQEEAVKLSEKEPEEVRKEMASRIPLFKEKKPYREVPK